MKPDARRCCLCVYVSRCNCVRKINVKFNFSLLQEGDDLCNTICGGGDDVIRLRLKGLCGDVRWSFMAMRMKKRWHVGSMLTEIKG